MLDSMPTKTKPATQRFHALVKDLASIHLLYALAYTVTVLLYDAWDLFTPDALAGRWLLAGSAAVLTGLMVYKLNDQNKQPAHYQRLVYLLIGLDIVLAAVGVYFGRGMASRTVALFFLPIIVAAVALKPKHIFLTTVCALAYAISAKAYFMAHPSEGYKIELYSDLAFYSATFFVAAALLYQFTKHRRS
jgi:hypothetical protein